ncbi:hypothetical protein GWO43_20330 [candidate division KSB1 bacterium]|nr:hypothetical protein [candidate division KSB1 bacterium]NIV70292.1 hypothetical protein [Phycisphaerae bacterium]NIR71798.1 hypothetical protein [candidate division KSB1 bacterium]NIS26423.1 hypothetical protein [candidate division KSB1 bacterium]NIT73182.1 hypothetical protein [candidate division KSB1 bacterium]
MAPPLSRQALKYSETTAESASARSPKNTTLYAVTRSTEKFRIFGRDNPTVGLFTTSDRGKSWQHWGWHYTKCFSATIEPNSGGNVIYLACGNGIQKSKDSGKSWVITTGWEMTECLKVTIDPVNTQSVYAATAYGIYKSEDGGGSWTEKNHGLKSTFTPCVIVDRSNPGVVYCATEAGVYKSNDGAESWGLLGLEGKGIRTILQSVHDEKTWFAGTEDEGIFVSTDAGKHWKTINEGLESMTIYALAQDPANAQVLYAGTFRGGVYKTVDCGRSWQSCNEGLTRLDIHALLVDPSDSDVVYCGTLGGGVFLSEDAGAQWEFIGLETSQVWDFTVQ